MTIRSSLEIASSSPCKACGSYFCNRTCSLAIPMPTDPTPVPAPQPSLRKAALEALVAIEVWLSQDETSMESISRMEKVAAGLAEALLQ